MLRLFLSARIASRAARVGSAAKACAANAASTVKDVAIIAFSEEELAALVECVMEFEDEGARWDVDDDEACAYVVRDECGKVVG